MRHSAPTSIVRSIKTPNRVASRGLLDTSVLVELDALDAYRLPDEMAIAAVSLAELAAAPHATADVSERARRQERLQRVESTFHALPFDTAAARAYGRIYAAIANAGRKPRGQRAVDLFIAATALAAGLPIYTRNAADFAGLADLVEVISIG